MQNLTKLQTQLNIQFKNPDLLENAFIHRSYLNETEDSTITSNERLEFLGDAVIELIVSEYLFNKYPQRPEGELTAIRAALVRTESLAEEARQLDFGQYLQLSKGEEESGGREREYILANTFEAFTGALYLDQGYKQSKQFINQFLLEKTDAIVEKELYRDAKSLYQELTQEKFGVTPTYKLVSEKGPDHDKEFEMGVYINNKLIKTGTGNSKQAGEEEAARKALEQLDS